MNDEFRRAVGYVAEVVGGCRKERSGVIPTRQALRPTTAASSGIDQRGERNVPFYQTNPFYCDVKSMGKLLDWNWMRSAGVGVLNGFVLEKRTHLSG